MSDPTIPLYNRASDVKTLHLDGGCEASWLLKHLYPDETPGAVWFALGTAIHAAIEQGINNDWELFDLHGYGQAELDMLLAETETVIEGTGKRNISTVNNDLHTLIDQWWEKVHPSSPRRIPVYNQYKWPPTTEYEIELAAIDGDELAGIDGDKAALYTTVDAIFHGTADAPFGEEILVVDWKTGASKRAHPSQLQVYMYGLRRDGTMKDLQTLPGVFHHVAHENLQRVNTYVGDEVVQTWLDRTAMRKQALIEYGAPVFNPQFLCNYCVSKVHCPIYGGTKTVDDIRNTMQEATLLHIPERVTQREGE